MKTHRVQANRQPERGWKWLRQKEEQSLADPPVGVPMAVFCMLLLMPGAEA